MRESELLAHIFAQNAALPDGVTVPPGDDMGAVRIGGAEMLVTVDQLANGVHFDLGEAGLALVGRKAMTRNLSDVAAMAARPVGAVAAACLPREMSGADAQVLCDAMRRTGEAYGCPLIGGDVSVWDGALVITVTVLAEAGEDGPVLRSGARVGDVICVTGEIGGAWSGGGAAAHHLNFEPRIEVARQLVATAGVTVRSMIDLSDGLATDLGHVCRMSGVGAAVEVDRLPLRARIDDADGRPGWLHGMTDGEDYELCFTVRAEDAEGALPNVIDGVAITRIGRIEARQGDDAHAIRVIHGDGRSAVLDASGWEHGA